MSITARLGGIAITGLVSGNGTWEYSTDGGLTWIAGRHGLRQQRLAAARQRLHPLRTRW